MQQGSLKAHNHEISYCRDNNKILESFQRVKEATNKKRVSEWHWTSQQQNWKPEDSGVTCSKTKRR